ncbi:hypothetical protein SAMN06295912_11219 [Sphingomonas laterariae]|uniref:PRTRC system protein F n=2 Tax=Sphingomonadales TaxID=204457 RepID=A0A239GET7_9SPHN|nr:hypothetical protein [Novosphingobium silvae]BAV63123.1 hypothetical protein SCLO_1000830 [Sphingobium cloacae]SNS67258.1 hypothetical protein SAMN06295912_11219 [Sphingomonas laterariae]
MHARPACPSRRSADLAGRAVAISADVPAIFDAPLPPHHKLIGRWVAAREASSGLYTRAAARQHIEGIFNAAVLEILDPIEIADFRVAVILKEGDGTPAIAVICQNLGQIELGWIETGDAPIPWRAAAYRALEQCLGRVLPIFSYEDLFNEISIYYWDGETDDERARQSLIAYHGADADELDELTLPSEMNARRPEWMIKENAAPSARLPSGLRQKLKRFHAAHKAVGSLRPERNAWDFDLEVAYDYIPGIEECSSLPPLTLVPFDHFARELDDVARNGMEMGFMEVAGLCPLRDAHHIDDWFASVRLGAEFLLAAQELIQVDPAKL